MHYLESVSKEEMISPSVKVHILSSVKVSCTWPDKMSLLDDVVQKTAGEEWLYQTTN